MLNIRFLVPSVVVTVLMLAGVSYAQQPDTNAHSSQACEPCNRPGGFAHLADSVMDVQMADGFVIRSIRSAARTSIRAFDTPPEQAIRFTWIANGQCHDTVVRSESVVAFLHEGIGGTQSPLRYPVAPAREIMRSSGAAVTRNFLEVLASVGYGGSDTSSRAVGFSSFYEGLEAVVAPLGDLLGDYLSLGVGGGLLDEGGRLRFPLYGELRFNWPGSERVETVSQYYPDSCSFATPGDSTAQAPWRDYTEVSRSKSDRTVFFTRDRALIRSPFRPYIYLDAGTVFDSKFDGSGLPDNAVNPDYRKPLLLGVGVGHPIGESWTIALGYRYMQLHLATPCPQCVDRTIINRNTIHSITLRAGWRMGW